MKVFIIVFLCFHQVHSQSNLLGSLSETRTFNASITCLMVQNGTFLKDPRSCSSWIQCNDKQPISGSCTSGLFYDRNTNKCVNPDLIKCYSSDPCADVTTKEGTFVADPKSCTSYYYCLNGKATLGLCSSGLNYNPKTQVCIKNFTCPVNSINPNNWCNIIPDGQFFTDLHRCQGYYFCENGVLVNGTCPEGYYFNSFKSLCDYEDNVECLRSEKQQLKRSGNGLCQTSGQFLSDNKTCSGYYYCQQEVSGDFELIWQTCSDKRFFDPSNGGECGYRRDVECNYDRCDGMGFETIQLVNSQADSCKGYLICQDGKQIGQGICPQEENYFDEELQKCTSSVVEYPACSAKEFLSIKYAL